MWWIYSYSSNYAEKLKLSWVKSSNVIGTRDRTFGENFLTIFLIIWQRWITRFRLLTTYTPETTSVWFVKFTFRINPVDNSLEMSDGNVRWLFWWLSQILLLFHFCSFSLSWLYGSDSQNVEMYCAHTDEINLFITFE